MLGHYEFKRYRSHTALGPGTCQSAQVVHQHTRRTFVSLRLVKCLKFGNWKEPSGTFDTKC
jgi:hypothetical protein